MTREQKNKLLKQINGAFETCNNVKLHREQFDCVLASRFVNPDNYDRYRASGYEMQPGKWIRCIK